MKILSTSILALACIAPIVIAAPLFARSAARGASQQKPPPDRDEEFRTKFHVALDVNAKEEIAKLVRVYPEQTISYSVSLCTVLPDGGGETIEKELSALREAWKTTWKSAFIERLYNFWSLLEPRAVKDLEKLNKTYDADWRKWDECRSRVPKDAAGLDMLAKEFETLGKSYADLGYQLFAARSFNLAGKCTDTDDRGASADLNRTADNYAACVHACEAWELNDGWSISVKQRFDALTREGRGTAAGAAPGSAPAVPTTTPVKSATPIMTAMHFEAVPNMETYERPSYFLDEFHILWPSVNMKEKGSSGVFPALDYKKVKLLRVGAAELKLDFDGDGKGDQIVPASGNKALVQFSIGEGAEKRDWAVLTEVGTDKEFYEGLQVNYGASDQQFQLYVISAASMVGALNNVPLRVFDDNMDGIYGSWAKEWQYPGLPDGSVQPDIDAILVGADKHARPWSEYGEVGGAWYQFETQKAGIEVKAVPTTFETGKLKLDYKGDAPEYVIVQGEGSFEKTFFDLLQNGGAEVDVPAGKYHLYFGLVRKGKKQQSMKALILPGKRTPAWIVEPGKTATITLGAPYGFDFQYLLKDGKLTVKGSSVTLTGSQHERYERLWNCVPRPELLWRKAGTKKASKPERLGIIEDLNEKDDKGKSHDPGETFHPTDLTVETKLKEGEAVEVQLAEKKNKLFGAIESAWIR